MVPTLTKAEVETMLNDVIPNNKKIPESIVRKAEAHARKRISEGKSVFKEEGEIPDPKTQAEYDAIAPGTVFLDEDGVRKVKR